MRYIDRNGSVTEEDTQQDKLLRHLYNDRGGRLCLRVLVKPAVSVLGGCFLNSPFSKGMISGFIERNQIDLAEYEPKEYVSYNDFFIRKIKSGMRPLPEEELPLLLPDVESYMPTDNGESPLAAMTDWVNTTCPCCGGPAKRETDTMPQWAGSSWYFLRYTDPLNDKALASPKPLGAASPATALRLL